MYKKINLILLILLTVFISACGDSANNLKTISQQKVGDKVVSILSTSETLKKGAGSFYLEFHNASDNNYSDMGKIQASAFMQMTGNPMPGEISATKTEIPGRYDVKYNFPMAGTWSINFNFEIDGEAKFSVPVN